MWQLRYRLLSGAGLQAGRMVFACLTGQALSVLSVKRIVTRSRRRGRVVKHVEPNRFNYFISVVTV